MEPGSEQLIYGLYCAVPCCGRAQVAALRQRASILQLYGLALLRCQQTAMLEPLLAALVGASSSTAAVLAGASGYASNGAAAALHPYASASGTAALLALQHACGVVLPQQGIDIPSELQQIQQDMIVDDISVAMLLNQPSAMESSGVVTLDDYGQPVFDFQVCFQGDGVIVWLYLYTCA